MCGEGLSDNQPSKVNDWPELDEKTKKKVFEKIDTGWKVHIKED